jgi:hypothetical protein
VPLRDAPRAYGRLEPVIRRHLTPAEDVLAVIRHFARKLRVKARDVERALFDAHRAGHEGRLYKTRRPKRG